MSDPSKHESGKRYYTISEVAELFGVSKSLIRFWESEFDTLKPYKNSKGDRRFTQDNLEQLKMIYHLVKERGFTLHGAKQEIKMRREWLKGKQEIVAHLKSIKGFLEDLRSKTANDPNEVSS